ncbi:hypothetical protein [Bacillus subtilis]|uniref:hypothetical protein n=1 Tax=Bacillus subtilis TaxID=1423 RepID=UPI0020266990|nr:hypothetical protein [Bacillus subtilis]MCL9628256.1 hypothetical protein [Bacillus subtilis]
MGKDRCLRKEDIWFKKVMTTLFGAAVWSAFVLLVSPVWVVGFNALSLGVSLGFLILFALPATGFCGLMYRDIVEEKKTEFKGKSKLYLKIWLASVYVSLSALVWSILLIVPGILKGIGYSQTLNIIKDNPKMSIREATKVSEDFMKGRRVYYVRRICRSIGITILGAMCVSWAMLGDFLGSESAIQLTMTGFWSLYVTNAVVIGVFVFSSPYHGERLARVYNKGAIVV